MDVETSAIFDPSWSLSSFSVASLFSSGVKAEFTGCEEVAPKDVSGTPNVSVKDWNVLVLFLRLVRVFTAATWDVSNPNLSDISVKLLEEESERLKVFLFKCDPQTPELRWVRRVYLEFWIKDITKLMEEEDNLKRVVWVKILYIF